jgi:hypothetical protein
MKAGSESRVCMVARCAEEYLHDSLVSPPYSYHFVEAPRIGWVVDRVCVTVLVTVDNSSDDM